MSDHVELLDGMIDLTVTAAKPLDNIEPGPVRKAAEEAIGIRLRTLREVRAALVAMDIRTYETGGIR